MNALVPIPPPVAPQPGLPAVVAPAARARLTRPKLTRADWIMAGFEALVQGGPAAIRAEAMARALGATKGSFYWHFKDLRDFHSAMLAAFEDLAKTGLTASLRRGGGSPQARLMQLAEAVSATVPGEADGAALEPALRDWARTNPMACAMMGRVDARRLADLAGFLHGAGLDPLSASEGAVRFYAALLGLEAVRITCGADMRGPLMAVARAILGPQAATG